MMLLFSNSSFIFLSWIITWTEPNKTLQLPFVLVGCSGYAFALSQRLNIFQIVLYTRKFVRFFYFCIHSFTTTTLKVRSNVESTYFAVKMKLINMQRQLLRKYILQIRSIQKDTQKPYKNANVRGFFNVWCARTPISTDTIIRTTFFPPLVSFLITLYGEHT